MALIAVAADKGSPGVTTTALVLGGVWPRRALVAECDPAGGDLVYRLPRAGGGPLDPNVGVLSLAAGSRRGLTPEQVWAHTQVLHGGLEVLLGLANAEQSAGLGALWSGIGAALAALPDTDVLADLGRLSPGAPTQQLLTHAAAVVLVARATADQVAHVRDRAAALVRACEGAGATSPTISILLIAGERSAASAADQVRQLLRAQQSPADVLGVLAHDEAGAALLLGESTGLGRRRAERSLLVRSAREVAERLQQQVQRLSPVAG